MGGIHDAVIDDDLQGVRAMLEAERTRVNAKDDNVSPPYAPAEERTIHRYISPWTGVILNLSDCCYLLAPTRRSRRVDLMRGY